MFGAALCDGEVVVRPASLQRSKLGGIVRARNETKQERWTSEAAETYQA